jgi:NADPH:quinone reductase-like Zn-dependent oxidoreductase
MSFRKIVVIPEQYGSTDFQTATKIVEVPINAPGDGEISVKVAHTGIEASDIIQMVGGYGALAGKKPATSWDGSVQVGDCGCEGVGTITAVGSGVEKQNFAVGDAVAYISPSFRESININVKTFKSGATPTAFKIPAPTPEWTAVVS